MWKNHSTGRSDKIAKVPYAGPIMDYKSWLPKNDREWDVIIGKSLVAMYALLACWTYSFMLVLLPILILYHFEWKSRD